VAPLRRCLRSGHRDARDDSRAQKCSTIHRRHQPFNVCFRIRCGASTVTGKIDPQDGFKVGAPLAWLPLALLPPIDLVAAAVAGRTPPGAAQLPGQPVLTQS
jgi:hypothetical protein